MADQPVSFKSSDAKRIAEATKYVERVSRGGDVAGDGGRTPVIAARYARASSSITARSGTTVGSGTFNFARRTGTTLTELAVGGTAYNIFDMAIANDAWLTVKWVDGGWEVDKVGDCANLS